MKRLLRVFAFFGGVGAVIAWMFRDRLVSVTTSREPEPPQFAPEPTVERVGDVLTDINGIGPTYAARLADAGVNTFAELAAADAEALSEKIEVPESRVAGWIDQAKDR